MKVLIIEDEQPAVEKLERYLAKYDEQIEVMDRLSSVKESVEWFRSHKEWPDLLFLDIQLSDGISFDIFNQEDIRLPIIFTTAFDEFALDAFRHHGIDYLLKPVTFTNLSRSLKKFSDMKQWSDSANVSGAIRHLSGPSYKDRFMVKHGQHIRTIPVEEVSLFFAEGRTVYLVTNEGRKYIIEYKLEELEKMLNPKNYFRVNRTFVINIQAIKDVVVYTNSRFKILSNVELDKEIIVSREKASEFRNWLEGRLP